MRIALRDRTLTVIRFHAWATYAWLLDGVPNEGDDVIELNRFLDSARIDGKSLVVESTLRRATPFGPRLQHYLCAASLRSAGTRGGDYSVATVVFGNEAAVWSEAVTREIEAIGWDNFADDRDW